MSNNPKPTEADKQEKQASRKEAKNYFEDTFDWRSMPFGEDYSMKRDGHVIFHKQVPD